LSFQAIFVSNDSGLCKNKKEKKERKILFKICCIKMTKNSELKIFEIAERNKKPAQF